MKAVLKRHSGYTTEINIGDHNLIVDEPEDIGGKDLGPTPTRLLESSLASCVAITLKMYAARKDWDVGDIEVEITSGRNEDGSLTFHKKLNFTGDIDADQLKQLQIISTRCPISRTLQKANKVELI